MLKLLTMLGAGLPAIISGLLAFITRKLGTAAGSIATFLILTTAFIACNKAIYDQLAVLLNPPAWVSTALGMFIPGDFSLCLASWVSAKICRAAYDMARTKLKFVNDAS